jgi:hypothetical protein
MLPDELYEGIHSFYHFYRWLRGCFSNAPTYYASSSEELPEPAVRKDEHAVVAKIQTFPDFC